MRGQPIIVEFVGLPGAGKTTASKRIIERMRAQGYSCGEREMLGWKSQRAIHYARGAAFCLRRLPDLISVLRLNQAIQPFKISRLNRALELAKWSYHFKIARDKNFDIVILDQGVGQSIWSVIIEGKLRRHRALTSVLSKVFLGARLPFVFIYFDISVDASVKRIRSRAITTCRFDKMNSEEASRVLTSHKAHLETIFNDMVEVTNAPHHTVDGGRTLTEICDDVASFIDSVTRAADVRPYSSEV